MPARNTIKHYVEHGYYHVYNRGVEKRRIFMDNQDYGVFLSYLKEYLLPKDVEGLQSQLTDPTLSTREKEKIIMALQRNNFADDINLLAYCLMSNHFHFLIRQKSATGIDRFMQSLGTRYTIYFNKRHKRIGPLYQDVYKASSVTEEPYFIHLSRYIHHQALASKGDTFRAWEQPSSFPEYLGERDTTWIQPQEILAFFSQHYPQLSYETFVREKDETTLPVHFPSLED